MTDHDAIRALVHRYSDAVTRCDHGQWIDTWTDDGVWDIGRGAVAGHDALLAAFGKAMSVFEHVVQLTHNGAIEIEGDDAMGRWYISEHGRSRKGVVVFYICHYDDEYRRTTKGWRFARRTGTWHYHGPPDLGGTFGPPPGYER